MCGERQNRTRQLSPVRRDTLWITDQENGAEAQIRTGDTGLFRAVLYQLSYLGTSCGDDRI
jgi:hypothetical protein